MCVRANGIRSYALSRYTHTRTHTHARTPPDKCHRPHRTAPTLAGAEADLRAGRGDPAVVAHRAGALFLVWRDAARAAAAAEEDVAARQSQRADVVHDAHGHILYTPSPRALFGSRRTEAHHRRVQERLLRELLDAALAEAGAGAGATAAGLRALVAAEPRIAPMRPPRRTPKQPRPRQAKAPRDGKRRPMGCASSLSECCGA